MAIKSDKAVQVFTASVLNKLTDKDVELAEARQVIQELAKNPTPANRYEIASLVAFAVDDVVNQRTQYLDLFADVQRVSPNEKAKFDVKLKGIQAFLSAKGATVERSRIYKKNVTLDTEAVIARPSVSFMDLAMGKVNFDEIIADAAYEMETKMVGRIQNIFYNGFSTYSTPNYANGAGLVKATLDAQIVAFQRLGVPVTLVGDHAVIAKLAELTGFTAATGTKQFAESIILDQNANGFVGVYNGCNVVKLVNPYVNGSFSETILKADVLYIVPTGAPSMRPLKVAIENDIPPMDATNIDDRSYEMRLDKHFGAGLVFGDRAYMGIYEDTSL